MLLTLILHTFIPNFPMMYSHFPHGDGHGLFLLLRSIFSLSAVIGALFLLAWTIKHLPEKKLMHLALWLLTVGIVGAIFMTFFAYELAGGYGRGNLMRDGKMMRGETMMWDDDDR